MTMSRSTVAATIEIKSLLLLNDTYFLVFKLNEIDKLRESLASAYGFTTGNVYPHPRKKEQFILILQSLDSKNNNLNFNKLTYFFSIRKIKEVSPNINFDEGLNVESFEKSNSVVIGKPGKKKALAGL
jgi:hypothetical protein